MERIKADPQQRPGDVGVRLWNDQYMIGLIGDDHYWKDIEYETDAEVARSKACKKAGANHQVFFYNSPDTDEYSIVRCDEPLS